MTTSPAHFNSSSSINQTVYSAGPQVGKYQEQEIVNSIAQQLYQNIGIKQEPIRKSKRFSVSTIQSSQPPSNHSSFSANISIMNFRQHWSRFLGLF